MKEEGISGNGMRSFRSEIWKKAGAEVTARIIFVRMNRKVHNARLINREEGASDETSRMRNRFHIENSNAA